MNETEPALYRISSEPGGNKEMYLKGLYEWTNLVGFIPCKATGLPVTPFYLESHGSYAQFEASVFHLASRKPCRVSQYREVV
jgi:hypothetical protein